MKTCNRCKKDKKLEDFFKSKKTKSGYKTTCKICEKQGATNKYSSEYFKNKDLIRKYNITLDEYKVMLKQQKHSCKICGVHEKHCDRSLAVDHCHETNNVRGLLCAKCNIGLGYFRDRQEFLLKAVEYLDEYEGK